MNSKYIRHISLCFMLVPVLLTLNACSLIGKAIANAEIARAHFNGETVNMKDPDVLDNDTLVYGFAPIHGTYSYIQTDASKPAIYMTPLLCGNGVFCFKPLEKDLSFQLIYLAYDSFWDNSSTFFQPGMGTEGNIAFTTQTEGLQFIGAYQFVTDGSGAALTLYPKDEQKKYELQCLEKMLSTFRGSKWEDLITARIEELQDEDE